MKALTLLVLVGIFSTSCAHPSLKFSKDGMTPEALAKDHFECERDTANITSRKHGSEWRHYVAECMKGKGYATETNMRDTATSGYGATAEY